MSSDRFAFGRNWRTYVEKHFSTERVEISKKHILGFLDRENLIGKTFLDIGCGSGLHSLAALRAGAERVVSFDYDTESVEATRIVRQYSGNPDNWVVLQGSVLDSAFMDTLEHADVVYSWGVLHHTGDQWRAIRNAAKKIAEDGVFYVALYTSDVFKDPPPEFWLEVKKRYLQSDWLARRRMEVWYIWRFQMGQKIINLPKVIGAALMHKRSRGMSYFTDIKDWLGGWPMEFSSIAEVKKFADQELGLELRKISGGQANTEYLFARRG